VSLHRALWQAGGGAAKAAAAEAKKLLGSRIGNVSQHAGVVLCCTQAEADAAKAAAAEAKKLRDAEKQACGMF
jgi:hypothetical protein